MTIQPNILIIDDDPLFCELKSKLLFSSGFGVSTIQDPIQAQEIIKQTEFDLILTDLQMEKMDGLEFLNWANQNYPDIPVILITGFSSVETAVKAIKSGAYDYLEKNCPFEEILFKINRALEKKHSKQELESLRKTLKERYTYKNIIGKNEKMQEVYNSIELVCDLDLTVLIRGETGTGKELVARAIHFGGIRKDKPFIVVNCAAMNENLVESELFGHEKGAFTGAIKEKPGKLELASDGTIFLDEIGDMSINLQAKLLRVLQDKKFERVGGTKLLSTDVRVITATNRNLEQLMKEGKFREDLYHRINAIAIYIPPLRERFDDMDLLIEHFLHTFNKDLGKNIAGFSPETINLFINYPWPGNIRELENVIRKLFLTSKETIINADHVIKCFVQFEAPKIAPSAEIDYSIPLPKFLEDAEKEYIISLLKQHKGKLINAAQKAGIDRRTLYKKMKLYNIKRGDFLV